MISVEIKIKAKSKGQSTMLRFQVYNKLLTLIYALILSGCAGYNPFTSFDYYGRHPQFPPRASATNTFEYQIAMHRSWQDSVYLIAGKSLDEMYVGYSISNWKKQSIKPLKFKMLTDRQWKEIQRAFDELKFFEWEVPCLEKGYNEGKLIEEDEGECVEIIMSDGGTLSMLAVSPERIKGIHYSLLTDEDSIVKFADKIFSVIEVDTSKLPKWGN